MNEVASATVAPARGRPRLRSDEEILDAALRAFAEAGFEAMSVRSLSTGLGLSHEAVGRRFGTKMDLYLATIEFGFERLTASISATSELSPAPTDDLGLLRETLRTFMIAAAAHPDLGRILNREGVVASERLGYIVVRLVEPAASALHEIITRLVGSGRIRPTTARELFFLAQAGAAPFTLAGLSLAFDAVDGPFDPVDHINRSADLIVNGLLVRND